MQSKNYACKEHLQSNVYIWHHKNSYSPPVAVGITDDQKSRSGQVGRKLPVDCGQAEAVTWGTKGSGPSWADLLIQGLNT